ncbi:MarR family winged helix-turn-helix transcriptional regulator [Baekduia sp. Peel2402]|uniref:MarR family winged helix-turn-helix transcriptional regulator n=1 Tax=Baekduia sp. Peel2402 TaxID=3458296 RepID=UPI00403EA040
MSSRLPQTTARTAPENLAILLREPFQAMTDVLLERLAQRGHDAVRQPHAAVFEFLDDNGTRVSVLAERARITKQSMAELVAHLEAHGYVARTPDPVDGRAKLVSATARGREVYAIARATVAELEARLAQELGERDVAKLRALLLRAGEALR